MIKTDVQIQSAEWFDGSAIFVDGRFRGSITESAIDKRFHVRSHDMLRFDGATLAEVSEYVRVWYRESDKAQNRLNALQRAERRDAIAAVDAKLLKYAR